MTERITPEQATLTPEIIAEIRSLDAQRDPECRWLMQTAEIRWRLERLAANCIIPALDEIERLQVIEKAAAHMDAVMGSDRLGRNESAVISEAAVWLENALNGIRDEPELRYWYETLDAALTPPPAREEGVTTDGKR